MDGDQQPQQGQDMSLTEFLLEDGQVVSELPDRRDATNYVEINVEPRDYGIAVEVFVSWRAYSWAKDIDRIARDASSRAGCIRQWLSRQLAAYTGVGQRRMYTFRRPLPRPIGPRMAEALDYIRTHPGSCKAEVHRGAGVRRSTDGTSPIDRLLRRQLIYDLGPSRRYALYAWLDHPGAEDPEDEDLPGVATASAKPVNVELSRHRDYETYSTPLSPDQKIELANHKPPGAYVARWFPEGWRWVSVGGRIGPKMEMVFEFVMNNPGCCKADAAWAAGLSSKAPFGGTWGPIERAISAGLITAEYVHRNRYRLFACGFDRRAYFGEIPEPVDDGCWRPSSHP